MCLIGAGILTFAWLLGPRRGNHLLLSISIVILSVLSAYNLIPVTWIPVSETWKVILIRLGWDCWRRSIATCGALCAIFATKSTA